jgi:hypothetical protein
MKFTLMLVDDGHAGPTWGEEKGKPKEVKAESIEALQESLDDQCKPFKVADGVWLLQSPPEVYIAVTKQERVPAIRDGRLRPSHVL